MPNEMNPQEVAEKMLHSAELLSEMQMNTPVDDDIIALEDAVDVLKKVANGKLVPAPVKCIDYIHKDYCKQYICVDDDADGVKPLKFCSYGERGANHVR